MLYDERSVRDVQKRDGMLRENHPHFQSGSAGIHVPEKLLVNGNLVSDQEALMSIWASHLKCKESCKSL